MTKQFSNYSDLLTFTRASKGHALRPVSYGPELVTNGTFDTTIGWTGVASTTDARWYINNGTLTKGGTNGVAEQIANPFVAGKTYLVQFDVTAIPLGVVLVGIGNATHQFTSTGTQSVVLSPTDVSSSLRFFTGGAGGGGVVIDNVSVKEVLFDQPDGTLTLFEHPDNIPRVEWDADGNRLGLLVEEARTNSILNSNDPTQWGTKTTTATQNLTGPDGVFNSGWTLEDTSESTFEQNTQTVAITANTNTHCVSFFIKKDNDESRFPEFQIVMSGNFFVQVNTKTGATYSRTNQNSGTIDVEDYGEWWRVVMTATNGGSATSLLFKIIPAVSSALGNIVSANLTGSIGFYGAQIELNASFPTSYMKTTGDTATRSADVASIPVADFGYNQSAGSFLIEFSHTDPNGTGDTNYALSTSGSSRFLYNNSGSQSWVNFDGTSSVNFGNLDFNGAFSKVAMGMDKNGTNGVVDGGTIKTSTSTPQQNVTASDDLSIGKRYSSGNQLNGHIKFIKYYPRRLTDAQLQDLTS